MTERTGAIVRPAQLLDQARRGKAADLSGARVLAHEIGERRPGWWGEALLSGQIDEIEGRLDDAIQNYRNAIQLGNRQPDIARRLLSLLGDQGKYDQIDEVMSLLTEHGMPSEELAIATVFSALRQRDFDRAVSLARRICEANSTSFADHLILGQVYVAAGRVDEAGKEFRRALELAPGLPIAWVSYVGYLVQFKQINHAKATIELARKALSRVPARLPLAQCYALIGDSARCDEEVHTALESPSCDKAMIRAVVDLYMSQARFDRVEPILVRLYDRSMRATPDDLSWANRTLAQVLSTKGRLAELDAGLKLLEKNLKNNPISTPDQRLKAVLLTMRNSGRGEAIQLLEGLQSSNQLGAFEQFLLAQLLLAERNDEKYQDLMLKLLEGKVKNPNYLAHFLSFLIQRGHLDQAEHRLAELKQLEPKDFRTLELEAMLLKARNRDSELLAVLEDRGRRTPEQVGQVAALLDRYGFRKQAESAYRTFVARNPKETERLLVLVPFLARTNRVQEAVELLQGAWKTCRPEAVAATALALYHAPSSNSAPQAPDRELADRGSPQESVRNPDPPTKAGHGPLGTRAKPGS